MSINNDRKKYILFNEDLKEEFIESRDKKPNEEELTESNDYTKDVKVQIRRLLSEAYIMEKTLGKDLCLFSLSEMEEYLRGLKSKSIQSVYKNVSFVRSYVNFCITKQIARVNVLNLLRGTETLMTYVDKMAESLVTENDTDIVSRQGKYITRNELHNIIYFCVNAQDSALFGLLFEGAYGVALDEIRNLKKDDCDFETGEIVLTKDDGEKRTILIEDTIILDALFDASEQQFYQKSNGRGTGMYVPVLNLQESDYVFRTIASKDDGPITYFSLNARLKGISNSYGNYYLNAKNIRLSGMIDYSTKLSLQNEGRVLEKDQYIQVCKKYGKEDTYWYTVKRLISKFI